MRGLSEAVWVEWQQYQYVGHLVRIAKAVGVLGPEKGLKLIEETPDLAAMVTRAPDGNMEHYESSRWKELPQVRLNRKD